MPRSGERRIALPPSLPISTYPKTQQDPSQRIQPPNLRVEAYEGEYDTERVEDHICDCVLSEGLHRGVFDEAAPEPDYAFDQDSRGHDDDGGGGELDDGVVGADELLDAFDGYLGERGDLDT